MSLMSIGSASYGLPLFPAFGPLPLPKPQRTPWLITIVDLVTLLLAFFVLMFSMSHIEPKRYAVMAKSYGESFNPAPTDEVPLVRLPKIANIPGDDLGYLEAVLRTAFAKTATLKDVQFHRTAQYLILSLPVDGVFMPGSGAFVDSAAGPIFDLGGVLSNLKNRIAVVGSAIMTSRAVNARDSNDAGLPPAAEGSAAWELAVARAQSMADALKRAGYGQPVTVFGRGGAATDVEAAIGRVDIMIMPEQQS